MLPLLPRPPTILGLGLGLGLSLSLYSTSPFRTTTPRIQCQYAAPYYRPEPQASPETGWAVDQNDPVVRKQGRTRNAAAANSEQSHSSVTGWLSPRIMRQASFGSVLGLAVGVGLRAFSRVLTVVFGMGVVFVEWAASKGYNLIPVGLIQRFVTSVDVQKALTENVPFKVSFGATVALAAFAQFRDYE